MGGLTRVRGNVQEGDGEGWLQSRDGARKEFGG